MTVFYVWADGTKCAEEDLGNYLQFMSDDFLTVVMPDAEDEDDVPEYDEIIEARRAAQEKQE